MIGGEKLTEREVLARISSTFQIYETEGGRARYRTAVVLKQQEPLLSLDGEYPPFIVWTVAADSRTGNTHDVRGYESRVAAEVASVEWVGEARRVSPERMSASAWIIVMSSIQGVAWR